LRASVSFSGGAAIVENGQVSNGQIPQDKSFSFVKHDSSLKQSASNANTSFSSRQGPCIPPPGGQSAGNMSVQKRREIVDRLIDNRKRSAEKRQILQIQQQLSQIDPSLDENAWQII
jgi:hypothetical protein